jgi:hypothetical protein
MSGPEGLEVGKGFEVEALVWPGCAVVEVVEAVSVAEDEDEGEMGARVPTTTKRFALESNLDQMSGSGGRTSNRSRLSLQQYG